MCSKGYTASFPTHNCWRAGEVKKIANRRVGKGVLTVVARN